MATVVAIPTTQPTTIEKARSTRGSWRSSDLDLLPENGTRYEIIQGELFMSKSPHWHHQAACSKVAAKLITHPLTERGCYGRRTDLSPRPC